MQLLKSYMKIKNKIKDDIIEVEDEEMKKKKTIAPKCADILASMAKHCSENAVNSRCVCIYHQPKMPTELQKLKRD